MKRAWGIVLLLVGCTPAPPVVVTPTIVGCGKDTDCKGDRICHAERCVAPPAAVTPTPPSLVPAPIVVAPPPPQPVPSAPPPEPPPPVNNPSSATSCDCAPKDLMCAMRCGAAQPKPDAPNRPDCDCPSGDLMCMMRCSQGPPPVPQAPAPPPPPPRIQPGDDLF